MKKLLLVLITASTISAQDIIITTQDSVLFTFTEDFYGIQYDRHAFTSQRALDKLKPLRIGWVRQWAYPRQFHPQADVWDWSELDEKIITADSLGFRIILCIFQGEDWDIDGTADYWWNVDSAEIHWKNAVHELASRYRDKVARFLLFDELNYLHPESDYYITFKRSAEIYMTAAREIKSVNPELPVGGPSGFGGWENGHWANYVLQEPNGREHLDFISSNLFIAWHPEQTDEVIMDRTIWYEEAPQKIQQMLGNDCPPLVLDAYNINGLWQWEGELWTDQRNTNFFGAIYHALAKLHSAKGNFKITLHWSTIGGYGIFQWYPDYIENPNYYCWKFLIDYADLKPGSQLLGCSSSEPPKEPESHHGGMNVNCYSVQPFAIRNDFGEYNIILINKYLTDETVKILNPAPQQYYRLYRFDADHQTDTFPELRNGSIENDTIEVTCPSRSISVIRISDAAIGIHEEEYLTTFRLSQNFPNPFNPVTTISYHLPQNSNVILSVFDMTGRRIETLVSQSQNAGTHQVQWNGSGYSSGVYSYELRVAEFQLVKKMLLVK